MDKWDEMVEQGEIGLIDAVEARWYEAHTRFHELESWKLEKEIELIKTSHTARGIFRMFDGVDDDIVHMLMNTMDVWSLNHPEQPITLLINSPGGVVISGFALYDFLEELKRRGHHITTKGFGMQASMGGVLLQAGDERVMSKRSRLLIHEVQGIVAGSFSQMEDDQKFNETLQEDTLDILCERSTLSKRQIKNRWKRKDWWLRAPEALKLGFIDRIED